MIKGVIFDMDGVLVDNRDIHLEAFHIFCKRYGCETPPYEKLLSLFGKGNDEIIPVLLPASLIAEKGIKALSDEKEQIYRDIFAEKIAPTPGLLPFLQEIRANGIRTAVGSSGPKDNVDYVLNKCGIADLFDVIVHGDMVTRCKPDPSIFLLAANLLKLPPVECLVIEDAFAGIEAAHRAGMPVIALSTTYSADDLKKVKPNLIVPNFTKLSYNTLTEL